MNKEQLDEKYSYQIDKNDIIHLFRGEDECQQHLINPLISAIFKIEDLQKENAKLRLKLDSLEGQTPWKDIKNKSEIIGKLTKAREIMKRLVDLSNSSRSLLGNTWHETVREAEDFLKENK